MRIRFVLLIIALVSFHPLAAQSADNQYVGAEVCASCHRARVELQAKSRHAETWKSPGGDFPSAYPVELEGLKSLSVPVHSIVGGNRFGFSSILEMERLEDAALPRKTLIEARFMLSAASHQKTLSPGFPEEQPVSYATAAGKVLSPDFARKCLSCHGAPAEIFRDTSIRCERCHGPGQRHVQVVKELGAAAKNMEIVHPGKLDAEGQLAVCAPCHAGFSRLADPRPDDLLISNQVTALKNSACYVKSGKKITCLTCHNPHTDARHDDPVYERACLSCHSAARKDVKLCSAGKTSDCVPCHMPVTKRSNHFPLRDHWIRVVERTLPENIRARVARGAAMAERGEKVAAVRYLESLLPNGGDEPSLHYTLGLAYEETERPEDALRAYRKAIQLEPDMVAAYINLGSLLLAQGKIEEAIRSFQKAVEINPLEVAAHYNLAVVYDKQGGRDKAQHELQLVAAIDPRMKKKLTIAR